MAESVEHILQSAAAADPTWLKALRLVRKRLTANSNLRRLLRGGWLGIVDQREFVRLMGFSRLRLSALFRAAAPGVLGGDRAPETLQEAVGILGLQMSAAVLAVNYTCSAMLKTCPPPVWKTVLTDMMNSIEVGTTVGARVMSIGMHGGLLAGFARGAGMCLLLADDPQAFKKWHLRKDRFTNREAQTEAFGCEVYQVSALVLQQLGFGTDIAIAVAVGVGHSAIVNKMQLGEDVRHWRAVFQWVDALREGRGVPPLAEDREYFPELKPQAGGKSNPIVSVLYTEVARVKSEGSRWTWHLPRDSYEATMAVIEERLRQVKK